MVECGQVYEHPIEHLFKAITILQVLEECDEEVASLKAKLMGCFEEIPMRKEGYKFYDRYRYYPTGLCQYSTDVYKTINLDPYETELVEKKTDEQVTISQCLIVLRDCYVPRSVYYQVCDYLKVLKVTHKVEVQNVLKQIEEYEALPKESKECLKFDPKKIKDTTVSKIEINFGRSTYRNPSYLNFLTQDQIENLIIGMKLHSHNSQNLYDYIREFFKNGQGDEEKEMLYSIGIPLTYIDERASECNNTGGQRHSRYNIMKRRSLDDVYEEILTITEPTAVSVLSKVGIIPKVKRSKKKVVVELKIEDDDIEDVAN